MIGTESRDVTGGRTEVSDVHRCQPMFADWRSTIDDVRFTSGWVAADWWIDGIDIWRVVGIFFVGLFCLVLSEIVRFGILRAAGCVNSGLSRGRGEEV